MSKGQSKYGVKYCRHCKGVIPMRSAYGRRIFCSNACAWGHRASPEGITERFWSYVEKGDGCWLYTRTLTPDGYGYFRHGGHKGPLVQWFAHRYAWTITHGAIPAGKCVCHTCDVRNCVNPEHLWLGTHEQNMRDSAIKFRGTGYLTPEQVLEIRNLLPDMTQKAIAEKLGLKRGVVWGVASGRNYIHVG